MGHYTGISYRNPTLIDGTAHSLNLLGPRINGVVVNASADEINMVAHRGSRRIAVTTASAVLWHTIHDQRIVILNLASGVDVNLEAANGSGAVYRITVGAAVTSPNVHRIRTTSVLSGSLHVTNRATGEGAMFSTLVGHNTINMNGGTTGGLVGGIITLIDIMPGHWAVMGNVIGTGTPATPFMTV